MITPDAERTMSTFLGISSNLSLSELNLDQLENSHYLFLEGYLVSSPSGFEAIKEAKKRAKTAGVKTALTFSDPSMVKYFGEQMHEVVGEGVDLLFCNEEEALLYAGTDDLTQAIEKLKKIKAETLREHAVSQINCPTRHYYIQCAKELDEAQ